MRWITKARHRLMGRLVAALLAQGTKWHRVLLVLDTDGRLSIREEPRRTEFCVPQGNRPSSSLTRTSIVLMCPKTCPRAPQNHPKVPLTSQQPKQKPLGNPAIYRGGSRLSRDCKGVDQPRPGARSDSLPTRIALSLSFSCAFQRPPNDGCRENHDICCGCPTNSCGRPLAEALTHAPNGHFSGWFRRFHGTRCR